MFFFCHCSFLLSTCRYRNKFHASSQSLKNRNSDQTIYLFFDKELFLEPVKNKHFLKKTVKNLTRKKRFRKTLFGFGQEIENL